MLGADIGGRVVIKTAHGDIREMPVAGLVHDPGLAPAWQERSGYAYISRATLTELGEAPVLHELRIALRDPAADLGRQLVAAGHPVHEIRVLPPRQHPHQKQMTTILFLMLAFSLLALLLSAVLVANSLAAMLARQVREIGVIKTIGAQAGQIMWLYGVMVAALGGAALAVALPAGGAGAGIMAAAISRLLDFSIATAAYRPGYSGYKPWRVSSCRCWWPPCRSAKPAA